MEEIKNKNLNIDSLRITQMIIRFISSLSIFAVTVFFTPNFTISSFPILILSSIVIILLDYLMSIGTGIHDIPLRKRNCWLYFRSCYNIHDSVFCGWLFYIYNKQFNCSCNLWNN